MRRYFFLILFVLVLVLPAVVSRFIAREEVRPAPAGAVKLDVISPHNQDIRNAFAAAFSTWHEKHHGKPVELRFANVGGTGDITRLLQSTYRGAMKDGKLPDDFVAPFDLAWGGGDAFFDRDIKEFLQPASLRAGVLEEAIPQAVLNGVRLYEGGAGSTRPSAGPKWVGIAISSFGLVYNPDVYSRLGLPEPLTWSDLAREEMAGWIALANPMSSSSAATAYSMDFQRTMADAEAEQLKARPELAKLKTAERMKDPAYLAAVKAGWKKGMGELLLVSANARYITDSGSQPPNDVANGDAAAAMAIDFYGRANEYQMGQKRFRLIFPRGASAMNPDPIGILVGVKGERLEIANRFIEYLLTPEGQRLWQLKPGAPGAPARPLFRSPIRRDVYGEDRSTWTNPLLNPFEDDSGFFMRTEWMSLFGEIRFVWACSWVDSREELKDAYKAILAVPDKARRDALRAELADFPLGYDDLAKLQAETKKKDRKEVDEFKAKERLRLAQVFRDHYNRLRAKASDPTTAAR